MSNYTLSYALLSGQIKTVYIWDQPTTALHICRKV